MISALWLKNASETVEPFKVEPLYLRHNNTAAPDLRHWQIPFGRRFRSLKLWFVMRTYGIEKLQEYIRGQIQLAVKFEETLRLNAKFEIVTPTIMALVCFRLKDKTNDENKRLLEEINSRGRIHMVPTQLNGKFVIRFAICSRFTTGDDVDFAINEIVEVSGKF